MTTIEQGSDSDLWFMCVVCKSGARSLMCVACVMSVQVLDALMDIGENNERIVLFRV